MADKKYVPFAPGGYSTEDWSAFLGMRVFGDDVDTLNGVVTRNSVQGQREYVLVQNAQGDTLAAGNALKFTTGYFGTKVAKATAGASITCFAPPAINGSASNTIPDGAYFWAVKEGFTSVLKSTAHVTENTQMEASSTDGAVKVNSGTAYSDVVAGTFIAADSSGNSVLVRAYANCQW